MLFITGISNAQTVTIGTQVWMTKNLDVSTFRNGDPIPEAKSNEEWKKAGENKQPAWCYYNNDPANGAKYGKLYNWYAVNDPRGLAPLGYHVPTKAEFMTLYNFFPSNIGQKVKSEPIYETKISYIEEGGYNETKWVPCNNCSYWTEKQKANTPCTACRNKGGKSVSTGKYIPITKRKIEEKIQIGGGHGTNESGFSGLPGGYRLIYFEGVGKRYEWWSSSTDGEQDLEQAIQMRTSDGMDGINLIREWKGRGLSVRCVKD